MNFVDARSALVKAYVSGSTVRCRRVSTLWWLSQWRTSWSQHGPGWQRNSCPGSTWAWVSFSATAVYTLTTEAGHGRGGGWWTDVLMLCCLSLGVFYGGVCIGMAGVASLMGNILQVNPLYTQSQHFKCNTAVLSLKNLSFSLYQWYPLLITDCNDTLWNHSSTGSSVYIWYDQWSSLGPLYAGHVLPLCELHGKNIHLNVLITTFQVYHFVQLFQQITSVLKVHQVTLSTETVCEQGISTVASVTKKCLLFTSFYIHTNRVSTRPLSY